MTSRLVFGTAAFGSGYAGHRDIPYDDACVLALDAMRQGVRWFDTAPAYGTAEQALGQTVAWRANVAVATKVPGNVSLVELRRVLSSSRISLGTNTLDMVQIHNATVAQLAGPVLAELRDQQDHGYIELIGASVYEEDEALAAIDAKCSIVQVPFNLIDQRMARRVFPEAVRAGVGVWARSIWLRGMLAPHSLFDVMNRPDVQNATEVVKQWLWCATYTELAAVALRFVASFDAVTGIVIGPRSKSELHAAIAAEAQGPLGIFRRLIASALPSWPADVYDPRRWG